jgi:4-hydroxy-tetrahydrodipicolinate reductase
MNITLIGYGKMGKAIEQIALGRGHRVDLKIDLDNTSELSGAQFQACDVAIEFTGPASAFDNIMACLKAKVPVVSGSTGWHTRLQEAEKYCLLHEGCLLWSSNFSIGVNIFFELNKKLASLLAKHREYQVAITEIHHTQKKDAPSGTAITLAEQILEKMPNLTSWVNHPTELEDELVILSERQDPSPGTHKVIYRSEIDDIEIIHTAHSRTGFALGAVLAAEFIAGKKGVFSLDEVLGF